MALIVAELLGKTRIERLVRVGRKRKNGHREPNGKPQREKPVDTKTIAATMLHRKVLPEQLQDDWRAESVFGRLLLRGWISKPHYAAGIRYRKAVMRYRAVMSIPSHSPKSLVIDEITGGSQWLSEQEIADRRSDYKAAYEALERGAGIRGARAVAQAAIYEDEHFDPKMLKCGLEALKRHYDGLNYRGVASFASSRSTGAMPR